MKFPFKDSLFRCNYISVIMLLVLSVVVYITIIEKVQAPKNFLKADFDINFIYVPMRKSPPDKIVDVYLETDYVIHETNEKYLSVSIDSSQIKRGLKKPSLKDKDLMKKISHLRNGYLRVGGTYADLLIFTPGPRTWSDKDIVPDGGLCTFEGSKCPLNSSKFYMSADNWNDVNNFAKQTGLKLLFDLNVLLRSNNITTSNDLIYKNKWDSSNAELLLDFSYAYHYEIDWQLGNEPNSFRKTFGLEISAHDLSKDFTSLRELLNKYGTYNKSLLVGPDVTNPRNQNAIFYKPEKYFSDFLSTDPSVDAFSWHHYYMGPKATLKDYLNVEHYDNFIADCRVMVGMVKARHPNKSVWITETGSSYGGGAISLSDRFVASFLWADKLGAAARENISLIVRHSIYHGSYALLDQNTLSPNPDYWVSILYKKLIGKKVLNITISTEATEGSLRVYAHCAKNNGITIFGINIARYTYGINLMLNSTGDFYSLTTPDLQSPYVDLNGIRLTLYHSGDLPIFHPVLVNLENIIPILPYSIFFIETHKQFGICV